MRNKAYLSVLVLIALCEGALGFLGFALVLGFVSNGFADFSAYTEELSHFAIVVILVFRLLIFWLLRFAKLFLIGRITSLVYTKLVQRINHRSRQEMKRFLNADISNYISGYNSLTTFIAEIVVAVCLLSSVLLIELDGKIPTIYLSLIILASLLFQVFYRLWLRANTIKSLKVGAKYQGFVDFIFSEKRYVTVHEHRSNFLTELILLGTKYISIEFDRATLKALVPYIFETIGLVVVVLLLVGLSKEDAIVVIGIFARLIASISRVSSSHQGIVVYRALNKEYYAYSRD